MRGIDQDSIGVSCCCLSTDKPKSGTEDEVIQDVMGVLIGSEEEAIFGDSEEPSFPGCQKTQ